MTKPNLTRTVFWTTYALGVIGAIAGMCLAACGPTSPSPTDPCPVDDGAEPDAGSGYEPGSTKFDIPPPPDYCDLFGETDPGFFVTVDEDGPVISPTACQGLYASCFISGVGTVDMWCDFPCGVTRYMTVDMPTEPGLYKVTFINPCE